MALCVKESGTWRNITTQCVKQSGTWRTIVDACIKNSSTWRCYGFTAPTVSISASPTSITIGESTTLTWTSTRASSVVSSNFGASVVSGSQSVTPGSTGSVSYNITVGNSYANSSPATTTVTVAEPPLGAFYEGGYIISKSGGTALLVAPSSSEVDRTWTSRGDSNTRAQAVSGCSGWFVPDCFTLRCCGYACRTYWDSYDSGQYWTNQSHGSPYAINIRMGNGLPSNDQRNGPRRVRSMRYVSY